MAKKDWTQQNIKQLINKVSGLTNRTEAERRAQLGKHYGMTSRTLYREVSKKTGYTLGTIKEIGDTMEEVIRTHLFEKKLPVKLFHLGTVFPLLKRPKIGVNLKGGTSNEKCFVRPIWYLKLFSNDDTKRVLDEVVTTQKDIDNLYRETCGFDREAFLRKRAAEKTKMRIEERSKIEEIAKNKDKQKSVV